MTKVQFEKEHIFLNHVVLLSKLFLLLSHGAASSWSLRRNALNADNNGVTAAYAARILICVRVCVCVCECVRVCMYVCMYVCMLQCIALVALNEGKNTSFRQSKGMITCVIYHAHPLFARFNCQPA